MNVTVCAHPAFEANRVRTTVSSNLRVIIPMPVISQPTLIVEPLPLKPYRAVCAGHHFLQLPPNRQLAGPLNPAIDTNQFARRTDLVSDTREGMACLFL